MKSVLFPAAIAAIMLAGLIACRQPLQPPPSRVTVSRAPSRVQWEYKVFLLSQRSVANALWGRATFRKNVENGLNGLGRQGWEYCGHTTGAFILKRRKLRAGK